MSNEINEDRNALRKYICENMHFTAAEAYKLLRTNLVFCASDNDKCKIFGITSSNRGEGKTTTSINLAYSLAQTDAKVLLIDGDLRLPSVAKTLDISKVYHYGLSDLVIGRSTKQLSIVPSGIAKNLDLLLSGTIPPNPSELLSSTQMKELLSSLSLYYNYIIIDLPPVNVVTDALVISDSIDGYVVVVRERYTTKANVQKAIAQFKLIESKLFGFVMTDASENSKNYSRYKKYGSYKYGYKKYGYGYKKYGYRYKQDYNSHYYYQSPPEEPK